LELKRILKNAKSIVYIHSTFVGGIIEVFVADFIAAAERDIDVVLLWGERRDPLKEEPNQSELKGRLAYSKIPMQWRERIRLAKDPTGSHAKIILADSGSDGGFEAVVGSCNWLSCDYMALEMSVRLKDACLVREIAGMLADLSRPPSGAWGRDVTTLIKVQDNCRRNEVSKKQDSGDRGPGAMLVLNDEHYAAVRDARNASAHFVNIGCDLFGPAGEITVFEPLGIAAKEDGTSVKVLYNRPTETFVTEIDDTITRLTGERVNISQCQRLHGKFMAWNDEILVITSFNWLAASTGPAHHTVGELGVLIRDPLLVKSFLKRLEAATGFKFGQSSTSPSGDHSLAQSDDQD
jgi:phosphatidylserine/phosphatidylglycerophosphate/cardiolipin synthase-like enzyme